MKKVVLTFALCFLGYGFLNAQFYLSNNSKVTVEDAAQITLHTIDFENDGIFESGNGTMKFKIKSPFFERTQILVVE